MDWIKWDKIMESLLAQKEEFVVDIRQWEAIVDFWTVKGHDNSCVQVRLTVILQIGWRGEMARGHPINFKAWSAEQWWGLS